MKKKREKTRSQEKQLPEKNKIKVKYMDEPLEIYTH